MSENKDESNHQGRPEEPVGSEADASPDDFSYRRGFRDGKNAIRDQVEQLAEQQTRAVLSELFGSPDVGPQDVVVSLTRMGLGESSSLDAELKALSAVGKALEGLSRPSRVRVIDWAIEAMAPTIHVPKKPRFWETDEFAATVLPQIVEVLKQSLVTRECEAQAKIAALSRPVGRVQVPPSPFGVASPYPTYPSPPMQGQPRGCRACAGACPTPENKPPVGSCFPPDLRPPTPPDESA